MKCSLIIKINSLEKINIIIAFDSYSDLKCQIKNKLSDFNLEDLSDFKMKFARFLSCGTIEIDDISNNNGVVSYLNIKLDNLELNLTAEYLLDNKTIDAKKIKLDGVISFNSKKDLTAKFLSEISDRTDWEISDIIDLIDEFDFAKLCNGEEISFDTLVDSDYSGSKHISGKMKLVF